ncbi:MAG: DUF4157 domain-containing protein [Deltaproteobacteria bacterium]|nr:DUF4157 domain-containing protein [Deltaproteobacteria bacterium]
MAPAGGAAGGAAAATPATPKGQTGGNLGGAVDAKARQIVAAAQAAAASNPSAAPPGEAANSGGGSVQRQVQFDGDGGDVASTDVIHSAAEHGVSGAGGALPHADKIQAAFGSDFDVSGIQAHVGGAAAEACDTMGASAFATGDHVAFGATPDLHTAAHEAAHVVQQKHGVQLYGGVGEVGDSYERHADAVADRVVAGESAADLLSSFTGGGGGGVQQKKVQLSATTGATGGGGGETAPISGTAPTGGGGGTGGATHVDHFKVELKAWIPHRQVVDPEEPLRASDWLDTLSSSIVNHGPASLHYEYHSHYGGDNHAGYDGSSRAQATIEFDWDGTTISGFRSSTPMGASPSHRHYNYRAYVETLWGAGPDIEIASGSDTDTGPAGGGCSGRASGTSGHLTIAAPNLMTMGPAPDINSDLDFFLGGSTMNLVWLTDLFPSHGYRVYKNGAAIKTQVVNDASGVNAEGVIGAVNLGTRLISQTNVGIGTAP